MTTYLTVADAPTDIPAGTVGLTDATLNSLAVSPGKAVEIEGTRLTAAVVADAAIAAGEIALDELTRRNARVAVGDEVAVESIHPPAAATVTLSPTQDIELQGEAAFERVLDGRVVTTGDRVEVPLFGGGFRLTATVIDTRPEDGPVRITEDTTIEMRDDLAMSDPGDRFDAARLADVGGLDDTVDRLLELIAMPLSHQIVYDSLEAPPPTGVLLHGPSGGGKTLLVRALATELDAAAITLSGQELLADGPDEAASRLMTARNEVIANAPAVLIIDDLDAAAPADPSGGQRRVISRLTAVLDDLGDREDVVVLATTTDPDAVAQSLRRGGRLAVEVPLTAPDVAGRAEILEILTRSMPLGDDIDLQHIAGRTHGFLGADLRALVGEAVTNAVRRIVSATDAADSSAEDGFDGAELTMADFQAGLRRVDPSGLRASQVDIPTVSDADVGGLEAARRELARAIEWPLTHPELFAATGVQAPSGVLLYGPPGTGKTLLAKAVANATDANFVSIAGPEILNRYVGESEAAVRRTFETARQHAPAVVFIDEVDAITPRRGNGDDTSGAADRVVSQLLTELDGLEPLEDVVVVAATNRPDTIDPALLRPGRLERLVEVPLPDTDARRSILEVHTRDVPMAEDVDLEALAAQTDRYTGSDLEAVVREAGLLAIESAMDEGASPAEIQVRQSHIDRALTDVRPSVSDEMREYYKEVGEDLGQSS